MVSRRAIVRGLGLSVAAARCALASAGTRRRTLSSTSSTDPIAPTRSGKVRGRESRGIFSFRGIPYGTSTAFSGRFLPPRDPKPWTDIRPTLDCGPPCAQVNADLPAWRDPRDGSEDCLYLNIWTPLLTTSARLPVMVWIHGGAYMTGSGGLALYDGNNLARAGNVVVVSVNHRLGALGYLYLGHLDERYRESGNVGQLDLIAALRWIRRDIETFGGDPGNVTLFGESGGGAKISNLCQMPDAAGLFHKCIIQSGSIMDTMALEEGMKVCRQLADVLAPGVDPLRAIQRASVERLASAATRIAAKHPSSLAFKPVIDGIVLPANTWALAAPPQSLAVPMLIGSNTDEAAYFVGDPVSEPVDDENLIARLLAVGRRVNLTASGAQTLIERYRRINASRTRLQLLIAIATDFFLWRDAVIQAEHKVRQGGAALYAYEFTWQTPCFGRFWAPHGSEIPFVFGNLEYQQAWDLDDTSAARAAVDPEGIRYRLAQSMMEAWSAFARTGVPAARDLPSWPAYDLSTRSTMKLGFHCAVTENPKAAQRAALEQVLI